jgi:hypothetical protein
MTLGYAIHLRHFFYELAVLAASVKENEEWVTAGEEVTTRRTRRDVNEIPPEPVTRLN